VSAKKFFGFFEKNLKIFPKKPIGGIARIEKIYAIIGNNQERR
jgi:hypothetical protein